MASAGAPPATGPVTVGPDGRECVVVTAEVVLLPVVRDVLDCDPALLWLLEQAPRPNTATQIAIVAARDGTDDDPLPRLTVFIDASSDCFRAPMRIE